jgi:monoamine oxidase
LWGVARIPSGRCFFAGEHTQIGDYGFMTGAVASGNRAAAEVLSSLG